MAGHDASASWTVGASPGLQSASVRAGDGRTSSDCVVEVFVQERERGALGRETGHSLLVRDETEETGYGLYSYLLFGAPPDDDTRERFVEVLKAYLD